MAACIFCLALMSSRAQADGLPDLDPIAWGILGGRCNAQIFFVDVANPGSADAGPFRVDLRINGHLVASWELRGLAAGDVVRTPGQEVKLGDHTPGEHRVGMIVDPDRRIAESDEHNNAERIGGFYC